MLLLALENSVDIYIIPFVAIVIALKRALATVLGNMVINTDQHSTPTSQNGAGNR